MTRTINADPEVVQRIVPFLRLESIQLRRSLVEVVAEIPVEILDDQLLYRFEEGTPAAVKQDELFFQTVHFRAELVSRAGPNDQTASDYNVYGLIEATFMVAYRVKDDAVLSEPDVQKYCSVTGLYNAWPYWREQLASSLARVEFPGYTLPLLRVVPERVPTAVARAPA